MRDFKSQDTRDHLCSVSVKHYLEHLAYFCTKRTNFSPTILYTYSYYSTYPGVYFSFVSPSRARTPLWKGIDLYFRTLALDMPGVQLVHNKCLINE